MITVNGETISFEEGLTVAGLLAKLGFVFPLLVVRRNGKLVPREQYAKEDLADGDHIDVVHLMSGG